MTRGTSIFAQTLLLMVASLVATQFASLLLILSLPQPRPDFTAMSEVVDALAGRQQRFGPPSPLIREPNAPAPPVPRPGMIADPNLSALLATRLETDPQRVRLYFVPDRQSWPRVPGLDSSDTVPMRQGEPLFTRGVIAAAETPEGWTSVRSPPRPLISEWQKMSVLLFLISLALVLPLAWIFARRLSLPIRRFAIAADLLGQDAQAPLVPIEGPTELRISAHALNAMRARLADYLRERTAMIGAIAHDLRTPLARIAFRMERVDDDTREAVQADVEQMRRMIAATMDFAKGASRVVAPSELRLDELLCVIVRRFGEAGANIEIRTVAECRVWGDPISLERLFQNLLENAAAFGTTVDVSLVNSSGYAVATLQDDGPGLQDDQLDCVFEPFFRVDASRNPNTGGVGLGLTIARMVASDHGGTIQLSNRGDRSGLVATVRVPLYSRA